MKEEIISILKKYNFTDSEFDDVFEAMSDIIHMVADNMAASKAKDIYSEIARDLCDIDTFIESHE